jgi:quercetin dioxygenase-like cupin family protein
MDNIVSRVIDLPNDGGYFEIIGKQGAYRMRSGMVTLEPCQEVGQHSTEDYEEIIIILEGEGELESEGIGRMKIARGQVAYNPPDTRHNVINTGDGPLRYIYIVSKAR